MNTLTLRDLQQKKQINEKIACLTVYDATQANLVNEAGIDVILVGDSLGQVVQGNTTTLPATIEDLIYHTHAVARGNQKAFLLADMPFMSYATLEQSLMNAAELMRAGAHGVKLEGGLWLCETVRALTERGIPVCAHLGLTPQSVYQLGGYRLQGKTQQQAQTLKDTAKALAQAGASLLVLECIPSDLAAEITQDATIPTIGIGAGAKCDGQILVFYDVIGITPGKLPKFVKDFLTGQVNSIKEAIANYVAAVKTAKFPAEENTYC